MEFPVLNNQKQLLFLWVCKHVKQLGQQKDIVCYIAKHFFYDFIDPVKKLIHLCMETFGGREKDVTWMIQDYIQKASDNGVQSGWINNVWFLLLLDESYFFGFVASNGTTNDLEETAKLRYEQDGKRNFFVTLSAGRPGFLTVIKSGCQPPRVRLDSRTFDLYYKEEMPDYVPFERSSAFTRPRKTKKIKK